MTEGEGISKQPHMPNPQTQTPAWCWPEGRGGKGGEEVDKGGGGICNRINNKNKVKERKGSY